MELLSFSVVKFRNSILNSELKRQKIGKGYIFYPTYKCALNQEEIFVVSTTLLDVAPNCITFIELEHRKQ